jgi:hypothetical protein
MALKRWEGNETTCNSVSTHSGYPERPGLFAVFDFYADNPDHGRWPGRVGEVAPCPAVQNCGEMNWFADNKPDKKVKVLGEGIHGMRGCIQCQ